MSKKAPAPSDFRKILTSMAHGYDMRTVFDGFVRCAACAVACQTREPEYLEEVKRWKPQDLEKFSMALAALIMEMQEHPYEDLLGGYYMEFALSYRGQQWNGEFHTPKAICDLMAQEEWKLRFDVAPGVDPSDWDADFDNSTFYDNGAVKDNNTGEFVVKCDQVKRRF